MRKEKRDRPAWPLFLIILLLGVCCMLGAGQYAIQLAPAWSLIADVDSKINPNDVFISGGKSGPLEQVGAGILTQPAWRATFLTPGAFSGFVPQIIFGVATPTPRKDENPSAPAEPEAGAAAPSAEPASGVIPSTGGGSTANTAVVPGSSNPTKAPTKASGGSSSGPAATATRTTVPTATRTPTATATRTATPTAVVLAATSTVTETPLEPPVPTATATSTEVVVVPDTPTATITVEAVPSCSKNIYINEPPTLATYSLVDGKNNCLVYTNAATTKYVNGGIFTITNVDAGKRTFHYSCGGSPAQMSLDNSDKGTLYVDRNGNEMVVKISNTKGGDVQVGVAEWNSGSCPVVFQPQPGWVAWSMGLIIVAALYGILRMGMSPIRS